MVLDQRLYLTLDGKRAVPQDDPQANSLLGIPGDELDDERAKELGLFPKVQDAKQISSAPADKAVKRVSSKSDDQGA